MRRIPLIAKRNRFGFPHPLTRTSTLYYSAAFTPRVAMAIPVHAGKVKFNYVRKIHEIAAERKAGH